MSFASFTEFLAMGDHGLYVWLSYGVALIMALYNVVSVRVRQRRALQAVHDQARREAARRDPEPRGGTRSGRARSDDADPTPMVGESKG